MKKIFDKAFILYLVIGILNFIVCTVIMFLLYNLGICSENVAPLVNYGLGGLIWYFSCLKLIFPGQKQTVGLVVRFILEIVLCYMLCYYWLAPPIYNMLLDMDWFRSALTFLMHLPEEQFAANCNMAIGALLYAVVNYFGQRYFVFHTFHRRKKSEEQQKEKATAL